MKISVIVPVFNAELYLRKCLDSVLSQSYSNWEVIAIDDGSTDSSFSILEDYAQKDNRFIVEKKPNEGPGITRNSAIKKASGGFFVFLDSDDYIEANYFALLAEKARNPETDVVFIDAIQETPSGKIIKYEKMSAFAGLKRKDLIGIQMTGTMPWGGWRKAVRASIIRNNDLRFSADAVGEEAVFSFELLLKAKGVEFIDQNLYHYVNHPNSQSKSPEGTWKVTVNKMKDHLIKTGLIDEYRDAINAFGYTVLLSWILRNANNTKLSVFLKDLRLQINEFEKTFGWRLNTMYLRREAKMVLPFIKYRLLVPVVVAGRIRGLH